MVIPTKVGKKYPESVSVLSYDDFYKKAVACAMYNSEDKECAMLWVTQVRHMERLQEGMPYTVNLIYQGYLRFTSRIATKIKLDRLLDEDDTDSLPY